MGVRRVATMVQVLRSHASLAASQRAYVQCRLWLLGPRMLLVVLG